MTQTIDPRIDRIVEVLRESQNDIQMAGGSFLEPAVLSATAHAILNALASQHLAAILTAEDQPTAVYKALMPLLSGIPIDPTSRALITHLAVMVDQSAPGMGDARKAAAGIGESVWNLVVTMRANQLKRKETTQ